MSTKVFEGSAGSREDLLKQLEKFLNDEEGSNFEKRVIKSYKMTPRVKKALADYKKVSDPFLKKVKDIPKYIEKVKAECEAEVPTIARAKEKFWAHVNLDMDLGPDKSLTINDTSFEIEERE